MKGFLTLLVAAVFSVSSFAQTAKKNATTTAATKSVPRPKLVVGIVVDQMRYDYLYRYYDKYSEGGLKRMMNEGFNCRNNHYHYALTVTAAGHASVYTGSAPAIHGIVGNDWFDRISGKGVYCVGDSAVSTVGSTNAGAGKMSPRNLLVSTVTDQLRIATNFRNKTIGVSIKDRGSILPAGHTANAAYWFDSKTGNWITSTFYRNDLPQWLVDYNNQKWPSQFLRKGWNTLLPIDQYTQSSPDNVKWEGKLAGKAEPTFPYEFAAQAGDAFGLVYGSPWGNTMTKDVALAAIKNENLGKGKDTDFLAVSFSSPDNIGHRFGPNSVEQEDDFIRLDLEFADMLNFLDGWVGKGNYTVFLTADHGVMDVPGFWQEHKLPAGILNSGGLNKKITAALTGAFGEGDYIRSSQNYQIYLNHSVLSNRKISVDEVHRVIREAIIDDPSVANVLNLRKVNDADIPSYQADLYKNLFHAKRSGDIQIVPTPNWFSGGATGTTHGTPYNYDTHVPFVLYGWGIQKGETLRRTTVADIAPTISALLRILPPSGSIGNPVIEALK